MTDEVARLWGVGKGDVPVDVEDWRRHLVRKYLRDGARATDGMESRRSA